MQEKTILVPEIIEITNFKNLEKKLCPVCEMWHSNNKKKCLFCHKNKLKSKNTLPINFKPLLLNYKEDKKIVIIKFLLLTNKYENIFFNIQNLNFFFKIYEKNEYKKETQILDLFLEDIYKILNIKNINIKNFKKKYNQAFDLFVQTFKRPINKRILMPMFDCKLKRRTLINLNIENFFL